MLHKMFGWNTRVGNRVIHHVGGPVSEIALRQYASKYRTVVEEIPCYPMANKISKDAPKDAQKDEPKDELKDEPKDAQKDDPKDARKDELKDAQKDDLCEQNKNMVTTPVHSLTQFMLNPGVGDVVLSEKLHVILISRANVNPHGSTILVKHLMRFTEASKRLRMLLPKILVCNPVQEEFVSCMCIGNFGPLAEISGKHHFFTMNMMRILRRRLRVTYKEYIQKVRANLLVIKLTRIGLPPHTLNYY